MKKYIITYISSMDGDCCKVWTEAESANDAITDTKREYWDVDRIISVREM